MQSWRLLAVFAATVLVGVPAAAAELTVEPAAVEFDDAFSRRQLLVSTAAGDVTRQASYESSHPDVVRVEPSGYVVPVGPGSATLTVRHDGAETSVAVTVRQFNQQRPVDFQSEVVPLLSRFGCNAGGCHGKAGGQNGFQLSLFGFDTAYDYAAIVQAARGRRVFPFAPQRSLLLTKATGQAPHGGGRRIEPGSEPYRTLLRWIEAGMPPSAEDAPQVVALRLSPAERVMQPDARQQLAVLAEYSDGSLHDVTRDAQFDSNLDVVAVVDEDGLVRAGEQSGEATVMARYMGQVGVFRAMIPHGEPLAEIPGFMPNNSIDELAAEKWKKLGLMPSPPADDATFLRRVTLDLCGRLPTSDEAREFLADDSSDKRSRLIDRLLESPDYPAFFALRWGTILRNSRLAGADQAAYAFHNWIKEMIARNRPYDEFVRGVVAAAGEWQSAPAINWYWQMRDDQLHQVTADTAQVFLGVRLRCAQCHHHPYERWGQEDYYGLAGFFTRLGRKSFGQPPPYFSAGNVTTGEKNPLTGRVPEPKYPDGDYATFSPEQDPRHALVDWMAQPDNPYFARVMVNRLWGHFLGRGLVDPVDDLRQTNPPSNPELLDALARDFIDSGFDTKHVIRTILNSRVYQLSSEPTSDNRHDRQNFARYYARRLYAEVFLDAVDQACGTRTRFGGVSDNARAVDLPHEGFGSYFLDAFDRPKRVSGCECERSSGATLAQVLLLANSDEMENKLADGNGKVARLFKEQTPIDEVIEELYLGALARRPTAEELQATLAYIERDENKQRAAEDVLWTLLNSREFMFNH